jgi:hypothetical protein
MKKKMFTIVFTALLLLFNVVGVTSAAPVSNNQSSELPTVYSSELPTVYSSELPTVYSKELPTVY